MTVIRAPHSTQLHYCVFSIYLICLRLAAVFSTGHPDLTVLSRISTRTTSYFWQLNILTYSQRVKCKTNIIFIRLANARVVNFWV